MLMKLKNVGTAGMAILMVLAAAGCRRGPPPPRATADRAREKARQRVPLPAEPPDASSPQAPSTNILVPDDKGQLSYTGLIFAPDGGRIYLSNVNGSIKVFTVGANGTVAPSHSIPFPAAGAPRRAHGPPAGPPRPRHIGPSRPGQVHCQRRVRERYRPCDRKNRVRNHRRPPRIG